ncbi:hypothetical protein KXX35_000970, partial [Aspergillus fumigatus]
MRGREEASLQEPVSPVAEKVLQLLSFVPEVLPSAENLRSSPVMAEPIEIMSFAKGPHLF